MLFQLEIIFLFFNLNSYRIFLGNQPKGSMKHSRQNFSLPGYPGCGTIVITYEFNAGIQGQEHPNPGQPYSVEGFPRVAYLPSNPEGEKILR